MEDSHRWFGTLLEAGTSRYPRNSRTGLVIANATGYLASLSSLSFAVSYATYDYDSLRPLVVGNLLSAACTATTPWWHRFGRPAAVIWLALVFFVSLTYFTSLLGRESGVILNLIGSSAVAFAILGLNRLGWVAAITLASAALIIFCWLRFPDSAVGIELDPSFTHQLFITSIVSVMAIVFVVIFYAFLLTQRAQDRTDQLLRSIMPAEIVDRLTENPGVTIAQRHEDACVLFSDMVGFTEVSNRLGPERIVALLDELFRAYDRIAVANRVEKIKTIGDAYMAVCGITTQHETPAVAVALLAVEMERVTRRIAARHDLSLTLRTGIAKGPVTAGVVGSSKHFYDVWGPTVNMAARLQAAATPGQILLAADLHCEIVASQIDDLPMSPSPAIDLKGFGTVKAWRIDPGSADPGSVDSGSAVRQTFAAIAAER